MGKSIYKAFKADETLEREGVWLDFGDYGRFRIARSGGSNQAYNAKVAAAFKPYRRQYETGTLEEDKAREVLSSVFADTIILGWENVFGESGEPMEFNRGNALKLMNELPELYRMIREESDKFANFKAQDVETIAKN